VPATIINVEMVAILLLLGFLALAAVSDIAYRKIYNWITYPGILFAWLFNAIGAAVLAMGWIAREDLQDFGWIGLADSLLGFVSCGFVLLVCYVLFDLGGGDVKLMAMVGAFLGVNAGMEALLWTFLIGGCSALIILIWRVGPLWLTSRLVRQVACALGFGLRPLSEEERQRMRSPLYVAPCALAAVLAVESGLVEKMM
jgi:prepilin peptidase CpaA